jgi:cardiolipin synthase (CMP-forming)
MSRSRSKEFKWFLSAKGEAASSALTPANQITLLRLAFVPILAILVIERHYPGALIALAVAAASDVVDGAVARIFHQSTPLGIALDPIADKLLMMTLYVTLAIRDLLPWWLTILVLSRDVGMIITALMVNLIVGYRPFPPSYLGKTSTVVQVGTALLALGLAAHVPLVTTGLVEVAIDLTAALTVVSGLYYVIVLRRRYALSEAANSASGPQVSEVQRERPRVPIERR